MPHLHRMKKNFVYLQSLTGRISTSFIGRYAVAGTQGRHSPSGVPGTRDYGSGYPYGTAGAAGMLGAKHIKFVATMNKDAIIKLVNEQMWAKTDADVPSFKAGDTITVSYKIIEGNKERVQSFRGVVIQIKGSGKTKMFTIRKVSNGVGVERIFPLYSPHIDKIEVNKIGVVRRARIYYLRDLTGKKARIKEKRMGGAEKK